MSNFLDIISKINNEKQVDTQENNSDIKNLEKFNLFSSILKSKTSSSKEEITKENNLDFNSSLLNIEEIVLDDKLNLNNLKDIINSFLDKNSTEVSNNLKELLNNNLDINKSDLQNIKNQLILNSQSTNNEYSLEQLNLDLKIINNIETKIKDLKTNTLQLANNIKTTLTNLLEKDSLGVKDIEVKVFNQNNLNNVSKTFDSEMPNILKNIENINNHLQNNNKISIDNLVSKYIFEQKVVENKPTTIMNVFQFVKNKETNTNDLNKNENSNSTTTKTINIDNFSSLQKIEKKENTISNLVKKLQNTNNEVSYLLKEITSNKDNLNNTTLLTKLENNTLNLKEIISLIEKQNNISENDIIKMQDITKNNNFTNVFKELKTLLNENKIDNSSLNTIKNSLTNIQNFLKKENNLINKTIPSTNHLNKVDELDNTSINSNDENSKKNNNFNLENTKISQNNLNNINLNDTSNNSNTYSLFESENQSTFDISTILNETIEETNKSIDKNIQIESLKLKIVKSQVDQNDFINKIIDLIDKKGKLPLTTLRIKLEPYTLGTLDVVLKSTKLDEQQNISFLFKASKPETLNLIQNNQNLLKAQIEGRANKNVVQQVHVTINDKLEEELKKRDKKQS